MENMASSELDVMETSMMSHLSTMSAPAHLSMREKSQLKRQITKEHNSNFRAGFVSVNEDYLHKAGIRGRKRYILYVLLVVLLTVAILNTALTVWLMWIYHISHIGMEPLELVQIPGGSLTRFMDTTWFDSLLLNGVFLGSRYKQDLVLQTVNSTIILSTSRSMNDSMVMVREDGIEFRVGDLQLVTPSGKEFFSLQNPRIDRLMNVSNLFSHVVETKEDLSIESLERITIEGSKGVESESRRETILQAKNVSINAIKGAVKIEGHVGIYISNLIPQIKAGSPGNLSVTSAKLCVCSKTGRLFVVHIREPGMGCHTISEDQNPCLA
ncbi:beta-sarcoglycan-like isoform X2 [Pomacea canaliculata]|uniref:beta-sarcoglycan-like isoform X2 n=1 Tax=Pomacea canaliculata TaxID=400727 RepID=UPI000D72DAD8|nr:beta-sarcoglycan-like isoform X2 [Pomacea canaliculata]